jgi:hypothetical protein
MALIAAAALMSCAPQQEAASDPAANDTPLAGAPVEPAINGAAPADPDPPPETASLTADGWGPLRIGITLAEVTAAAGPDADPEAVGGPEPEVCDIFHPARAPEGLRVMIEDGRLTRISLSDPTEVKTDRGLGPGDAAAAVEAAYGEELVSSPHEYEEAPAEYLTVWTGGGREETYVRSPDARGIRYEVDHSGTVDIVHAGGPSIQYVEGCL